MTKQEYRKKYKALRGSMTESERETASLKITDNIISDDLYKNSELVLVYVSVGSEIITDKLIDVALSEGKAVAVPYCIGNEMIFKTIKSKDNLVCGKYNIPTADETCPCVEDYSSALCIVPALSVDKNGNRLGYGGGFYDRFLASHKEVKPVVVCFDKCLCAELPAEETDILIPVIITENCTSGGASDA